MTRLQKAGRAMVVALAGAMAGPATLAAAERMFIPLGDGNAIVIVDIAEDKVIGRIEDVPASHGLAGTPDGRYLIAGSSQTRPAGSPLAKPAAVSDEDHKVHHEPGKDGASGLISTVTVVRQADGKIERRIDVPGAVHHVAASPDSRFAVVTHPAGNGISVIDLSSFSVTKTIPTGLVASYAVFSADGARLYVTNGGSGTVSDVDARSWSVVGTFKVGRSPEHEVLSRDGRELYVNNVKDGSVSAIVLADPSATRTYRVGRNPHGIAVSDDGATLYVAVEDDNKVLALDPKTGRHKALALSPAPYHAAVVRGHGKLYVSSAGAPKMWVVDLKSFAVVREVPIGGKGHQMVQSPRS